MLPATPRLAAFVVATAALASGAALARQSDAPRTKAALPAGDGRGMANSRDRFDGSFGRRPLENIADIPLESFGDIPLAPMGGLILPGPSERRRLSTTASAPGSPRRTRPFRNTVEPLPWPRGNAATSRSVASIRGVTLPPLAAAPALIVLPSLPLPELVFDQRPACVTLDRALREEIARAQRRGDADLVRSLAAGLGR